MNLCVIFSSPEDLIIKQYDYDNTHLYFLQEGIINITKIIDPKTIDIICDVHKNHMFNEVSAVFNFVPRWTYKSFTYCTVGFITQKICQ